MPLKILIVLAMVNCDLRHGEAWKESTSAWGRASVEGQACRREGLLARRSSVSGWGKRFGWSGAEKMSCCELWYGACTSCEAQGMSTGSQNGGNETNQVLSLPDVSVLHFLPPE